MEALPFSQVEDVLSAASSAYINMNIARLRAIRAYRGGAHSRADGLGDISRILGEFTAGSQTYRDNYYITGAYLNARNEKVFSIFQKIYQTNPERAYLLEICIYETELYGFLNEDVSGNNIAVFSGGRLLSMNGRREFTALLHGAKAKKDTDIPRGSLNTSKPIAITAETKSGIAVTIETDAAYLDRAYGIFMRRMALVAAAVGGLSFLLVWVISVRLNKRMRQLSSKIADISDWKLEREITIHGNDEFSLLARELDETRRRILALVEQSDNTNRLKREAEVSALRAQINSHFLFNSLSSIKWLSKRNDYNQLAAAVDNLALFLRYSLSLKEDLVPLKTELEHLHAYVYLQKLRYGDEINVHTDIAEELLGCMTLKLLLQPLVENAIYHGRREDGAPLNIAIYSAAHEGGYDLIVEDDGNGMTEERINFIFLGSPNEQRGYGLRNVLTRLRMCQSSAELQIKSDSGVCTRVIIRQPV
jgi:two-component system sensor histidine kinase YesM